MDGVGEEKERQKITPFLFVLTGTEIGLDMRLWEGYIFMKREQRDLEI